MAGNLTAGEILSWVWSNRQQVAELLRGLYKWFRHEPGKPAPEILILGPGGAGKTTLGRLLAGEYDSLLDLPGEYNESIDIEKYPLGENGVEVVVPPGQEYRRDATWPGLLRDIAVGKYRGVIFLTSFGHQTLGLSYKDHRLFVGKKPDFIERYLGDRRADELKILKDLAPHLQTSPGKLWLLSVVTKQDIWWGEAGAVEEHYRNGEYAAEVHRVAAAKGGQLFRHELTFASLVISNFESGVLGRRERLKPNTEGYDQRQQTQSLRRLLETVAMLRQWEEGA